MVPSVPLKRAFAAIQKIGKVGSLLAFAAEVMKVRIGPFVSSTLRVRS